MFSDLRNRYRNRTVWVWASVSSILIAAWFLSTVDASTVAEILARTESTVLLISLVFLTVNGLLDALWLRLITRPRHPYSGPLRVIAWHMFGSSILPGRIQEIAFIYFIHRWLDVPGARAVFITLYHRLQDFIVINLFMLIAALAVGFEAGRTQLILVAVVLLGALVVVVVRLEFFLSLAALGLRYGVQRIRLGIVRKLLRQVLQVRTWYRYSLSTAQLWQSFLVIVLRWAMILPAIGIVIHTSVDSLDWLDSLFLTSGYVYFGVIPIQAVGDLGRARRG